MANRQFKFNRTDSGTWPHAAAQPLNWWQRDTPTERVAELKKFLLNCRIYH